MPEKKADKTYPSQFEKVKEITDRLEAGIQALFDSDAYKNYLKTLSKFHDYSLLCRNRMRQWWPAIQHGSATLVGRS